MVIDACLIEAQPPLVLIILVIVKPAVGVVQMEAIARQDYLTVEAVVVSWDWLGVSR